MSKELTPSSSVVNRHMTVVNLCRQTLGAISIVSLSVNQSPSSSPFDNRRGN